MKLGINQVKVMKERMIIKITLPIKILFLLRNIIDNIVTNQDLGVKEDLVIIQKK